MTVDILQQERQRVATELLSHIQEHQPSRVEATDVQLRALKAAFPDLWETWTNDALEGYLLRIGTTNVERS